MLPLNCRVRKIKLRFPAGFLKCLVWRNFQQIFSLRETSRYSTISQVEGCHFRY